MAMTWLRWNQLACAAAIFAASACGGGSGDTTASSSTGATGGSGGSGATGGTGGAGTGGMSTGGTGGGMLAPFTSHGDASYEAQTFLAADTNGGVVAVWIGFFSDNTSGIGYAISRDAGSTFTPPKYIKSPGGRLASNPVVAVNGQGRFSLAWLGFRFDAAMPDEHIYVSHLDDATETFGAPIVASDDGTSTTRDFDKPRITVDANDNLLLTWADFTGAGTGTPPSLTFARSVDGMAFTRSTVVADDTFGNLASLCLDTSLGPTAPLYLVHLGANKTLTLRTSIDQGMNWGIKSVPATEVVFQDVTCAAHGADLWIAYASGAAVFNPSENMPGDVVSVVHSANGGDAFDVPVTVSNGGQTTQYLFPAIVRAPSGTLEIVYYQGTVGAAANLVRATSADGSAWTIASINMAGTFTLDRTLASWLGDYLGLAATAGGTFVSYTENSAGKAHIAFAKLAVAP